MEAKWFFVVFGLMSSRWDISKFVAPPRNSCTTSSSRWVSSGGLRSGSWAPPESHNCGRIGTSAQLSLGGAPIGDWERSTPAESFRRQASVSSRPDGERHECDCRLGAPPDSADYREAESIVAVRRAIPQRPPTHNSSLRGVGTRCEIPVVVPFGVSPTTA